MNAQAVAVGRSVDKRGIFVVDNRQKVYRITLIISGTVPAPDSMATLATGFSSLRDVAFSNQTQSVYLSEVNDSVVFQVKSAMTSSAVNKSQLPNFIPPSQLLQPTGLNLAPTNIAGTASDLLVVSQQVTRAIGQFDTDNGSIALGYLPVINIEHQDVAYDCTNTRIVYTRKTFAPGVFQYKK